MVSGWHPSNDEFLAMTRLHLEPICTATYAIGLVAELADDPLQPELASLLKELGAVSNEVLGISDVPALRGWQQFLQHLLAFFQRDIP